MAEKPGQVRHAAGDPLLYSAKVSASDGVTGLLGALRKGEPGAESRLLTLVYAELKRLARRHLRRERRDHTLQATDLVHEAYLRLMGDEPSWHNRAHFYGAAAQAMRRILVDYARAHRAQRRGGGQPIIPLDDAVYLSAVESQRLIEIDQALERLALLDPRQSRIVELRFFTGLSIEETAKVVGCAARTVNREWRLAQAWLRRELAGGVRA